MSCCTERHDSQFKTTTARSHRDDTELMKAGILLSSVAAACTASMGIAVWKLVVDRPNVKPTTAAVNTDESDVPPEFDDSAPEFSVSSHEDLELIPESAEWKVGDSRASLLRIIAHKVPSSAKPEDVDWDSDSDTTEWSSVADEDEYPRSWKSTRQRSSRWIHVGHGRYMKC
ncbi:hypothetical protein PHMEG_0004884 [Phytophthora megakarya]|uniref:Uncharacterized protein n=1 Tax=Phytophthora megakarya TaxID=4795 RepID=A0A225WUV9_9STRA|nr:hypothetical protein PHMEG_0004884 [Phytophthora megakarya]